MALRKSNRARCCPQAYEFVDTAIMVARKNNRQITLLHVYHHASTFFPCWWAAVSFAPGGDVWFLCALNSAVHVAMRAPAARRPWPAQTAELAQLAVVRQPRGREHGNHQAAVALSQRPEGRAAPGTAGRATRAAPRMLRLRTRA